MNLFLSSLPRIRLLYFSVRGSVLGHVEHTHMWSTKRKKTSKFWGVGKTETPKMMLKSGILNVTPQNSLPMM